MMKVVTLMAVWLTGALLVNCYAVEIVDSQPPQDESRSILVTYVDRTINRRSVLSSGSHYRARGQYKTSAWGQRKARKISNTHSLILVAQWPVTELGVYCVVYRLPEEALLDVTMASLRAESTIESVQPMNHFHTMAHTYSDPYYNLQNNIHRMQVGAAHSLSTGEAIKIAVIDTGIDGQHIDLTGQVLSHRELFSEEKNEAVTESESYVYDVHGTAVAGVIGAVAGNETGIIGVSPNAKLIALKACQASESSSFVADCTSFTLAKALNTAIRMKPDIINMSLGGPPDPLLRQLINHALDKGIIVVAAASQQADGSYSFPASMERVLGVSDVQSRVLGGEGQPLLAPGQNVLTTFPRNTYEYVSGSSISAAAISGIAALLLELDPTLSQQHIELLLEGSVSNNESQAPMMVNACQAIAALNAELSSSKNRAKELDCLSFAN